MKKLLSVLLAVMMLFGAVAMSASAADHDLGYDAASDILRSNTGLVEESTFGRVEGEWVLIYFKTGNFTTNSMVKVYDTENGLTVYNNGLKGNFWFIPDGPTSTYYIGGSVDLPLMADAAPNSFDGWKCRANGNSYVAGTNVTIDKSMVNGYGVVEFEPIASLAEVEEDTMGTILGILVKIFGTIVGLLFCNGDPAAGQELVGGLLGDILG